MASLDSGMKLGVTACKARDSPLPVGSLHTLEVPKKEKLGNYSLKLKIFQPSKFPSRLVTPVSEVLGIGCIRAHSGLGPLRARV